METSNTIICPLCRDTVDRLYYRFHIDSEKKVLEKIKEQNPSWSEQDGVCSRCVDYYHTTIVIEQRVLPEAGPHFPIKSADDFIILPTGLRLDADPRYTGKGVTICFIDSGFYLHPDLHAHSKRIKKMVDISDPSRTKRFFSKPHPSAWHGTMTSVVCAGDGYCSHGLYKGIASDAELVLLKVQDEQQRISATNICKALKWVLRNHNKYNIRIVNMSIGDDEACSYKESEVDILAERLVEAGIVVIAAVGNNENDSIKPPANALNVISIGGVDDENTFTRSPGKLYHSTYGRTVDGLMKPELLAHAIWIAAPILPGTREHAESKALHAILEAGDADIRSVLRKEHAKTQLGEEIGNCADTAGIRKLIVHRIQQCKYISPDYMHVDGTSFAAPIVCAVIAQLLEAEPSLTPAMIRNTLFSTAMRLEGLPAERQGYGLVQPRRSLLKILKRSFIMKPIVSPRINKTKKTIEFYIHNDCAQQISLAGSFNHWAQDVLLLEPGMNGIWKIEIPLLPAGRYQYKFFLDDTMWMEDVDNPYREPDGHSGFNSVLLVEN
ncbi:MAG TPA: S8 family serine peptidase [Ferruginibacter sp.]|nr:S8 family serine peptidase [Ferruginibacter sp.]